MGNNVSNEADISKRFTQLIADKNEADRTFKEIQKKMKIQETADVKVSNQANLLVLKIEILVNKLAIEEGKSEMNEKRVIALKNALMNELGITSQSKGVHLKNLVTSSVDDDADNNFAKGEDADLTSAVLFDIAGVTSKLREELREENKTTHMMEWFTNKDGIVLTVMDPKDFVELLCKKSETLKRRDAEVLLNSVVFLV